MAVDSTAVQRLAPVGFEETRVVALGFDPTAMDFAPDGRLFVAEQAGRLHVVKNGSLLPTPFLTVSADPTAERGLLGVAFDPDFATNRHVYVYYTSAATQRNRVSRFTADASNPDVAVPGSEVVLLDGLAGAAGYHNGGAIHFGLDGKLYVAVGDSHTSSNAQNLGVREGKLLRINSDGSVPPDNPFVSNPSARGEIWALGLRNPFTFAVQPGSGRIHINDVGEDSWEEINLGQAGANYGWPTCEGACANPAFQNPLFAYSHVGGNCAITGGTFYQGTRFPAEYVGSYFFADFCGSWIKILRPDGSVADFATVASGFVVDLKVGPDGSLYYLSRADRTVNTFAFPQGNRAPVAVLTAAPTAGLAPLAVAFDASPSSDPDGDALVFSWDFGDGAGAAGVTATHTYVSDGPYRVTLTADDRKGGLGTATVTISVGNAPSAVITLPVEGATYVAGDVVTFAGEGSDVEDGTLAESVFSWTILFHHETHTHPFVGPLAGARSGTFTIPTVGETSPDVWYRIYLTVTDASGLQTTVTRDVLLVKSTFTLDASPGGLALTLDGQPVATPHTVTAVVGIQRTLGAPLQQTVGPSDYDFASWSDGGAATHVISTPAAPTTYLATYAPSTSLVGSWDMNAASVVGTTLRDGSGAHNDGAIVGAVLAPGKTGDALAFDGNDYVSVADALSLQPQRLTLAAWVNPTGAGERTIFNKRRAGFLDSYTLRLSGSTPEFCLEPAAVATCLLSSGSPFGGNEWSHIAATWDGTTMRIYKNGVADPTTAAHTASSEYGAFPLLLGAEDQNGTLSYFFQGRLDDARIYRRALSAPEIVALYNGGPPDAEPPSVPQDLAAEAVTASTVQLSWSASTDNVGVVGYNVYRGGGFLGSTSGLSYTDQGLTASTAYTYEVSAFDAANLESGRSAPLTVTTATPPPTTTILSASFGTGSDGFTYVDDPFRVTASPAYASGAYSTTGGFSGGGLRVLLGGIDAAQVLNMSGGWRATFTLGAPGDVTVTLRYRLTQTSEYESDEYSDALVSVDGVLRGPGAADYLARIVGDGNGGIALTTGWQLVQVTLPGLAAGSHTVTIGGYNNKKTYLDEQTEILIDDVSIIVR